LQRTQLHIAIAQGPPSPRIGGEAEPAIAEPTDTNQAWEQLETKHQAVKSFENKENKVIYCSISVLENRY